MTGQLLRHHEPVMGTVVSFELHLDGESELTRLAARGAIAAGAAELHRLEAIFTTFVDSSPMSRYRRGELALDDCPEELPVVLEWCRRAEVATGGWFDPWALPGGIDPTGLVKGWAIEQALGVMVARGVDTALVNGGGDVATVGSPADSGRWRVGIQHPWRRGRLAAVADLPAGSAIATSGRYERGDHLVNPFANDASEEPVAVASATVVARSLTVADALATALAVGGTAAVAASAWPACEWYLIGEDGSEVASDRFPFAAPTAERAAS